MISYSDAALTISESLQTNATVWIHSLPEGEMGPTRRILEDLEGLAIAGGFPVFDYAVQDRAELSDLFKQLTRRAEQRLRPVVRVDAHGTVDDGLLLAPSGERVGWSEIIEDLRGLNVATANNLTCIFALCFGLHLYKQVTLKRAVPAYVTAAFEATLGSAMQWIHCQGLFLQSLLRYIRTYCIGRQRQERLEHMGTAVLQRDGMVKPSRAQLEQARRELREAFKPGQKLIDVFAPSFLIGRAPAFTYADLDRILKRSVRAGQSQPRSTSS